jgi:uncharacterized phage protein gp47/JayE
MATPICSIDQFGIHKPTYAECLDYFQTTFKGIYGQDIYIDNDAQDLQFLALISLALDDVNGESVSVYNSFSPSTAQGNGLSRVVKINGIRKKVPSASTALLTIGGVAGTVIDNGIATDVNGLQWMLPEIVTIPLEGQTLVTGTCATIGAVRASANTITGIFTPVIGWQTVTNTTAATLGQPVETDAELRIRQSISTMIGSKSIFDGMQGAIAEIPGVVRFRAYENDTTFPSAEGVPANSLAFVIDGGIHQSIINTIGLTKPPGIPTFGSTQGTFTDQYGIPHYLYYSPLEKVNVTWQVTLTRLSGYTTDASSAIASSLATWTNDVGIGNGIQVHKGYLPAQLYGAAQSKTFNVTDIKVARDGGTLQAADVNILFDEAPYCETSFIHVIAN